MVKTIRVGLDDIKYEELIKIKGNRTWEEVLLKGIEAIKKEDEL